MSGKADDLKSVLGKCFAILDEVTVHEELSLGEICERTGISRSTAYRMTKRLTEWGALQEHCGTFRVGLRLFEMGRANTPLRRLRQLAVPFMADLYEATHQVVHLGISVGPQVMYLEKLCGHQSVAVTTDVGTRMPLYCTSLGKALLAFAGRRLFEDTVRAGLVPRTGYTIVTPARLWEDLERVRATGVATEREEFAVGVSGIAAPVLGRDRTPIAALSVTVPARDFRPETLGAAVRRTSLLLGRALADAGIRGAVISGAADVEEPEPALAV